MLHHIIKHCVPYNVEMKQWQLKFAGKLNLHVTVTCPNLLTGRQWAKGEERVRQTKLNTSLTSLNIFPDSENSPNIGCEVLSFQCWLCLCFTEHFGFGAGSLLTLLLFIPIWCPVAAWELCCVLPRAPSYLLWHPQAVIYCWITQQNWLYPL